MTEFPPHRVNVTTVNSCQCDVLLLLLLLLLLLPVAGEPARSSRIGYLDLDI